MDSREAKSHFTALVRQLQRGEITKREFILQCVRDGVPVTTAAIVADGALAKGRRAMTAPQAPG